MNSRAPIVTTSLKIAFLAATAAITAACASAPPIVPAGPPTQVTVLQPEDHHPYTVRVTPVGSTPYAECVAPCQMIIPSGTTDFTVTSEGQHFVARAVVPPNPSTAHIRRRRNGLGVAGAVLNAIGGGFVAVSAALYPFDGMLFVGIGFDVTGILFLVPGLALSAAAGSDHVEFQSMGETADLPISHGASFAGASVVPVNGGAVLSANIRF